MATSAMPAKVQLIAMLVPRGWTGPSTLRIATHGNPAFLESLRTQLAPAYEMPVRETAEHLGGDLQALEGLDFPRRSEMLRAAFVEQGWQRTEFDAYRCRVRYPILHALVHLCVNAAPAR